jgi:Zn-dependent peptidase ImmA (M78 family)/transcriptional regulator with XRE-family HTH domain
MTLVPREGHSDEKETSAARQTTPPERRAVNAEALIIAREFAGFSQTTLAKGSGFSQAKISRFEDGITSPDATEAHSLAIALGVPVRLFYRSDIKRAVFNSFYRKRKSVSQKTIMQFNAKVCLRQTQLDRLFSKVEMESEPIPRFDLAEYPGGVRQVAMALRQFLKIPPGPVRNLVKIAEDAGVTVIMEDFGIPKMDGVSTFTNQNRPVVFLNTQAPPSRRRFSLAHEIAHTALHRYIAPDVDEQADALASEFLMPEDEIKIDLASQPITVARLAELKLKWRVSMAALLFRSKALNIIDQRKYYYLWTQISSRGYRVQEPHEEYMQVEQPTLEKELIRFHMEELGYTTNEIAESLDIDESEVIKRYGGQPQLKVI